MSKSVTQVPDLLRRFVPTPHRGRWIVGGTAIEVETNDLEIVLATQAGDGARTPDRHFVSAKIIRDYDIVVDGPERTLLTAHPLTLLMAGATTMLAFDAERRELLGFIASDISARELLEDLLPTLLGPSPHALESSAITTRKYL